MEISYKVFKVLRLLCHCSNRDNEDWVNSGDDDCDSEGATSLDTDDENESNEAAENEVHQSCSI